VPPGAGLRNDDFDSIYRETLEKFPSAPRAPPPIDPGLIEAARLQLTHGEAAPDDDDDEDCESLIDAILEEKHRVAASAVS